MCSHQLLLRASHAALLLVFCLQLGTNKAQENTRQLMKMDFQMPQITKANEEVTAKLRIGTELRECMVIKTYLRGSTQVDGPFNYKYTACLCDDYPRTFFWDFRVNNTMNIVAVVDIVRELNICPNNMAVIPITANRFSVLRMLNVV